MPESFKEFQGREGDLQDGPEGGSEFLARLNQPGSVAAALRSADYQRRLAKCFSRVPALRGSGAQLLGNESLFRGIELVDELWSKTPAALSRYEEWISQIPEPAPLYVALVMHGLAQAAGGRSEELREAAAGLCGVLGMPVRASAQVDLLLRHYSLLTHLSQRRELSELRISQSVAAVAGDLEALSMLCVMNYAADAATDGQGWTEWKDSLLWELYEKAHDQLLGPRLAAERQAIRLQNVGDRVVALLLAGAYGEGEHSTISTEQAREWLEEHLALLPPRYPLDLRPELVAKQILLANRARRVGAAVDLEPVPAAAYTRLLICCSDFPGLFACVTGTLAAMHVNIIGARLETRKDGVTVDLLWVSTQSGPSICDPASLREIADRVERVVKSPSPFPLLARIGRPSIGPPPLQPPEIRLSNEMSESHTVLEVVTEDRLGLAYVISRSLTNLGLTIQSAKLSTEKSLIYDVFYFTELGGNQVPQSRWNELLATLQTALQ